MNKPAFILLLSLLSLLTNNSRGQTFTVGIQAGYDITNYRVGKFKTFYPGITPQLNITHRNPEYSGLGSYNFNGYIEYKGKGLIGISAEPGYIRKGAEWESFTKIRLSYITLPVLVIIRISKKFSIGIGIESAYLLKATEYYGDVLQSNSSGGYTVLKDYQKNVINDYEKFELSALGGMDYDLFKKLTLAFRYSYGLTPVSQVIPVDNAGNEAGEHKLFNQVIQLSLRYNLITQSKN